tara:strand:- start:214 stop:408 length:195 start_codon:yes stop_codon:yes gene_type:complete
MKRPPGAEDPQVYECQDLADLKQDELREEMKKCMAMVKSAQRVSSQSWWAFRYDECLKRLVKLV